MTGVYYSLHLSMSTSECSVPSYIPGTSIGTSAGFLGNSYIEMPLRLLPHRNSQVEEVIEMTVRTDEANGLLLWHGQTPEVRGWGKDYLSVALHSGHVVFR